MILADLIALMKDGRIVQVGSAQEIYDEPRNVFAADFINFEPETPSINFLTALASTPSSAISPWESVPSTSRSGRTAD